MSTIVIHYGILEEQCHKLRQLSYAALAKNLQEASFFAISNPQVSLQKSLLVVEEILYEVYQLEMHTTPKLKNVRMLLNNRSFTAHIHPRRISLLMNLVYKMTSHTSNELVEAKAAKIVLDYTSDIVEWFIKRYDRSFNSNVAEEKDLMLDNTLYQRDHSPDAYKHAAEWFEIAAQNGDASAQYNLGALYNQGRGVKKDYALAKMWYERAAAQNDPNAHYSLGVLFHLGQGIEQNYTEAAHHYQIAADLGNADAQYNLGVLYNQGLGMSQNCHALQHWPRNTYGSP